MQPSGQIPGQTQRGLGGVPTGKVRYNNLKAAVAHVLGFKPAAGRNRRWIAFRSHRCPARTRREGEGQILAELNARIIDPASQLFARAQGHPAAVRKQADMNRRSLQTLADARRGLGALPTHGQVVAATTFGFWTKLTDKDRAPLFWNPDAAPSVRR